jgi:hypothetical protein
MLDYLKVFPSFQACQFLLPEFKTVTAFADRLCGLVVRVPSYRSRGPEFDSRLHQLFWGIVGLEWGPLSLVRIIE